LQPNIVHNIVHNVSPIASIANNITTRQVHSRRQLKRFAPGHGGMIDRRLRGELGRSVNRKYQGMDDMKDLDEVRDSFKGWIINPSASTSMSKLSNGFVPPPPNLASFTSSTSPTFRILRTPKSKGQGFYPIYTSYRNSGSRIFTTVKVSGNVLDFVSALHTMVVVPEGMEPDQLDDRMKERKGKEDFLEDISPAAGAKGGNEQWKVTIRGRWKREIEELLWGMGM